MPFKRPADGSRLPCVDKKMGGVAYVADISTQKTPAQQGTRLSQENEDSQRQKGSGQKTRKGQSKSYLLSIDGGLVFTDVLPIPGREPVGCAACSNA